MRALVLALAVLGAKPAPPAPVSPSPLLSSEYLHCANGKAPILHTSDAGVAHVHCDGKGQHDSEQKQQGPR